MVLVLVFNLLLLSLYAIAFRQLDSLLRTETVRTLGVERHAGRVEAVARGLSILESGLPPTDPYECAVTVIVHNEPRQFTVTFTSEGSYEWVVKAFPTAFGLDVESMPSQFSAQSSE